MRQQRTTEPMSDAPLVIDEATQKRDFQKTEAMYPNGAVVAGSTWETIEPKPNLPYNLNTVTETPISMANVLMSPYQMIKHWEGGMTYPGAMIEPSYNAMPAVPESASQQSQSQHTAEVPNKNTSNNANNSATPPGNP